MIRYLSGFPSKRITCARAGWPSRVTPPRAELTRVLRLIWLTKPAPIHVKGYVYRYGPFCVPSCRDKPSIAHIFHTKSTSDIASGRVRGRRLREHPASASGIPIRCGNENRRVAVERPLNGG
ncbi:hypothetical protein EVAR_3594_1 [Eumeta japonica]|uniref:Uncharacterized protein n=1 Tax=Eumeta variegata TaxID=151549 RepID=A0A4C1SVM5_EUMVA|nr:hypothetical protein EVAR_3594_1 [Eumeta japonica]